MSILVTGAAGYIGSVLTEELVREGNSVIALDNLQQGHREAVSAEAEYVQADLGNPEQVEQVFYRYQIDTVMHLAAESIVTHSMTNPRKFFRNNVAYGLNLLDIMLKHGTYRIIFSSTASVYGEPNEVPIKESEPEKPINPYGESKLMFEKILHCYAEAYGLKFISLRYFNAAGASKCLGEDHNPETHLIPNILKVALGQRSEISVFGTDYPTKDGSCIRDYIHVLDIAKAHILAFKYLKKNTGNKTYNLGSNKGYSVLQVIETARKVTGPRIKAVIYPRRQGDTAVLVANSDLAISELGWQPKFSNLEQIVESAWQWQKKHPHGYI
ncbi:UDP-glucose 4-epimerase GalE [Chloroflexota bacterium]